MNHHYVISAREVKQDEFTTEPGKPRFLKVPAQEGRLPHPGDEMSSVKQWVEEVRDAADGSKDTRIGKKGDVLIFLHGYNNGLRTIMTRQNYLSEDLKAEGFKGVVISFDWPSDDSTLNYLEDRKDAADVARLLVSHGIRLLARGQEEGCETNVHLLGHSTGAYLIMEAFERSKDSGALFQSHWSVGQVAFIGGDISAASLGKSEGSGSHLFERCCRLTNYSNPYDHVLAISNAKRFGTSPRAGRVGVKPSNAHPRVSSVNCGPFFATLNPKGKGVRFEGTFAHSWHIGNRVWARDLAMTLTSGIDREAISTRRKESDGSLTLIDSPRPKYYADWTLSANGG